MGLGFDDGRPWIQKPKERERSGCMTAFLYYVMAHSAIVILLSVFAMIDGYVDGPLIAITVTVFILMAVQALWNWQKWGFYALLALYIFTLIVGVADDNLSIAFDSLLIIGVIYYLYHDKLELLE